MEEDLIELRNAVADHQEQLSAVKQILEDQPDNADAQEVDPLHLCTVIISNPSHTMQKVHPKSAPKSLGPRPNK